MGETAEMARWREALNKAKEKKRKYEEFKVKVQNLSSEVSSSESTLKNAQGAFAQGGYNDGSRSVCPEGFDACFSNLDSAISLLESVIAKIDAKIGEIEIEIQNCQNNYNQAVRARDAAKNVEIKAGR